MSDVIYGQPLNITFKKHFQMTTVPSINEVNRFARNVDIKNVSKLEWIPVACCPKKRKNSDSESI